MRFLSDAWRLPDCVNPNIFKACARDLDFPTTSEISSSEHALSGLSRRKRRR
jgi:hypothetical protein